MNKKLFSSKVLIFIFTLTVFFSQKIYSENKTLLELNDSLQVLTLKNGLTVFIKQDSASALVHTRFVCKAGFSSQSASDAGFFPLFTQLFFANTSDEIKVTSECKADSSTYTADVPEFLLKDFLLEIKERCTKQSFSDELIDRKYNELKRQIMEYNNTTSSFINSAIDSRVFYEEPWKQDSGIYPAIFNSYTSAQIRTIIRDIGRKYYTSDNCALFLTGNLNIEKTYSLLESIFGEWETYYSGKPFYNGTKKYKSPEKKKYVLVADELSEDMNQLVVQYTSLSMAQADLLSASFSAYNSLFIEETLKEKKLGIRGKNYIDCASAHKSNCSRFIIQTLFEKNEFNNNVSPVEQVNIFLDKIQKYSILSAKQFSNAKEKILAKYKTLTGSPSIAMDTLSDYWSLDSSLSTQGFYQRFLSLVDSIQNESERNIYETISKEEPLVFLLLNTENFYRYKKDLLNEGYELITKENASWYSNETKALKSKEEALEKQNKLNQENQNEIAEETFEGPSFAQDFYRKNISTIKTKKLKNGIPVVLKENKESQTISLLIKINGGEIISAKNQKLLRTVLINLASQNIQYEISSLMRIGKFSGISNVSAWTTEYASYISINCMKEDLKLVLQSVFNAVVFADFTPILADSLIQEQKNQTLLKNGSLSWQLRANALEYLYRKTPLENYYNTDLAPLKSTNWNSVEKGYAELLDASLYTLFLAGDIQTSQILNAAEETLGLLKEITERKTITPLQPFFKNKNRYVQLRHTFTSDLPAELAPKESPILVPTKIFYDPAQLFFQSPESFEKRELFNALLYYFKYMLKNDLEENQRLTVFKATYQNQVGILEAQNLSKPVKYVNAYKNLYEKTKEILSFIPKASVEKTEEKTEEKAVNENIKEKYIKEINKTQENMSQENTEEQNQLLEEQNKILKTIKSLYIQSELSKTQTNEGLTQLIESGFAESSPDQYLQTYRIIENASASDFLEILENYLNDSKCFKVYSVDSKKQTN